MERAHRQVLKAPHSAEWGGLAGVLVVLITAAQLLLPHPPASRDAGEPRRRSSARSTRSSPRRRRSPRTSTSAAGRWTCSSRSWTRRSPSCPSARTSTSCSPSSTTIGRRSRAWRSPTVEPAPEEPAQILREDPDQDGGHRQLPRDRHVPAGGREPAAHRQRQQHPARRTPTLEGEKVVLNSDFLATTFRFLDPKAQAATRSKAAAPMSRASRTLSLAGWSSAASLAALPAGRGAPPPSAGAPAKAAVAKPPVAPDAVCTGGSDLRVQPDRQARPLPQPARPSRPPRRRWPTRTCTEPLCRFDLDQLDAGGGGER